MTGSDSSHDDVDKAYEWGLLDPEDDSVVPCTSEDRARELSRKFGYPVVRRSITRTVSEWTSPRERAEAEQDASDRAEADNYAKESSTTEEFWARHNAYLDGIRAERARQEAGQ